MSDYVIKVENLSKVYRIGLKEQMHDTLGGAMAGFFRRPLANLRNLRRLTRFTAADSDGADTIWALKDVSFEIAEGEVAGIIGRNGAGKSTLLKIISRITEPTAGQITLRGRVSSLLEVGTGFHPELTGRENVYLNGTILGMTKGEIDVKFDEIVAFAEVERFIDTPVKRYSSGMMVRLAFAVAAHLEPEILIVDEVLAVGDIGFQKKCLGKMKDVAQTGRTVLFVSHNMSAIKSFCQRTLLIKDGKIDSDGPTDEIVGRYFRSMMNEHNIKVNSHFLSWSGLVNHQFLQNLGSDDDIQLVFAFKALKNIDNFHVDIAIENADGLRIVHAKSSYVSTAFSVKRGEIFKVKYCLNALNLLPGNYFVELYIYKGLKVHLWIERIKAFNIVQFRNVSKNPSYQNLTGILNAHYTVVRE